METGPNAIPFVGGVGDRETLGEIKMDGREDGVEEKAKCWEGPMADDVLTIRLSYLI